jgi:hypothetical protein
VLSIAKGFVMRFRADWFPCVVLLLAASAGPAGTAEIRPSWECLPEGTAVMVRMPQPAEFLEAIRGRTKFGAVALSEPRLEGAWKAVLDKLRADGASGDLEDLEEALGRYDLRQEDLSAAFRGDMGAGFVIRRRDDGLQPLVMMLMWLEPGEETAARMVTAAQRKLEDDIAKDETGTTRRIDVEMAGHEVLRMVEPVMGIDPSALDLGDISIDGNDEEAVEKRLAELQERVRNAKLVKTGLTHGFLARLGGRLVVGQTLPPTGPRPRGGERDIDPEGGAEESDEIFERFLAAHGDTMRSPVAEALETPGMAGALPAGLPLLDVVIDPRVVMTSYGDEPTRDGLAMLGADTLGPIAWRQTLDEGRFRSGLFASLPAPRTSLMRILDQDCDAAEVPSFVTREAIDFTQISLDLGKAYETVKEYAVAAGGEQTAGMFMAVEMQAQGWLGVDLPRVLTSLGSRHWIVSYPPRVAEAFAEARRARGRDGGEQARQIADRLALIWQITDDAPFGKILQRLAGMAGGDLQEEQGFRGVRLPDGPAVFLGQNHLVVGIGADSLERTLTAIRNPPAGESSLRESDVPRRAAELLSLEPARMFGISDSSRTGGTLGVLRDMMQSLVPEDVEESYRDLLAGMQKLLPGDEEMEGMFGVGATTLRTDDNGISFQTAWEMPAP